MLKYLMILFVTVQLFAALVPTLGLPLLVSTLVMCLSYNFCYLFLGRCASLERLFEKLLRVEKRTNGEE